MKFLKLCKIKFKTCPTNESPINVELNFPHFSHEKIQTELVSHTIFQYRNHKIPFPQHIIQISRILQQSLYCELGIFHFIPPQGVFLRKLSLGITIGTIEF